MNWSESIEKAIEDAIRAFAEHEANLHIGLSGIEVLDFRRKDGKCWYALRIVFDNQRGSRVYISGDLGEAVVYPTCPARLEDMARCFTSRDKNGKIKVNVGYFLEKVRATSDRYEWSQELFQEDFRKECEESGIEMPEDFFEEYMDGWGNEIEVDDRMGVRLTERAIDALSEMDEDYREWVYDCGKRIAPRIVLWLVAMRLAWEMVARQVNHE